MPTPYKNQSMTITFSSFQVETTLGMLVEMHRAVVYIFMLSDEMIFTVEAVTDMRNGGL